MSTLPHNYEMVIGLEVNDVLGFGTKPLDEFILAQAGISKGKGKKS